MNDMTPGFVVNEEGSGTRFVAAAQTSVAAFLVDWQGEAPAPTRVLTWADFDRSFTHGSTEEDSGKTKLSTNAWAAIRGWFENGGGEAYVVPFPAAGDATGADPTQEAPHGLEALDSIEVQIVVAPDLWNAPDTAPARAAAIAGHCKRKGDRISVLHLERDAEPDADAAKSLGIAADDLASATAYYPWIVVPDPENPAETLAVPPTGHVAGVWARVDASRGVHKAPANEGLRGVTALTFDLSEPEQGALNDLGVNGLRSFRGSGLRVWGARTLAASDTSDVETGYLNVRRTINFIKESIRQSTEWVVFEPNNDALRTSVQVTVSNFLTTLWREGALVGATPDKAFYVVCDESNNPSEDVHQGKLTLDVGVAIVRPSEFVTFQITQIIDQS